MSVPFQSASKPEAKYHESAYYDLNEINRRVDTALLNTKDAIRQSQAGLIQRN